MRKRRGKTVIRIITSFLAAGMLLNNLKVVKADSLILKSGVMRTTNSINNNEYALIESPMTWNDAKAYAASIGAHLATITTSNEQNFISSLISSAPSSSYWVGGSDEALEGDFKWANGEAFSYSSWGTSEPNNYYGVHSENYITVEKATGKWNDREQSTMLPFICEWDSRDNYQSMDYNKDSAVDVGDISVLSQYYKSNNLIYDLNKDGSVDLFDLIVLSKSIDARFSSNNGVAFGNTSSNLMQGGLAAQSFNNVFYRNDADGGRLYKSNLDGSNSMKIIDDTVRSINVAGNWIYYKNDSDGGKLYKIKGDGSSRTKLMEDISPYYMLEDGWIYYLNGADNNTLCRIDINGLNKAKLSSDSALGFAAGYGYIFYQAKSDGKLYRIDKNGQNRKLIINGTCIKYSVYDGILYYINSSDGSTVHKSGLSGENDQRLAAASVSSIFVSNGFIYYIDSQSGIGRMKLDGKEASAIGAENVDTASSTSINVVQDWIFYSNKNDSSKLYKIKVDGSKKILVAPYRVYERNAIIGEFNNEAEAVSFAASKATSAVKAVSPTGQVLWHSYPDYLVMTGDFALSEYSNGQMLEAISRASTYKGGKVVRLNPSLPGSDMVWDENLYRVFENETLVGSYPVAKDAMALARQVSPRRVIDGTGQTVWNSLTNLKGYVSVDEYLNVRSGPSTAAGVLGRTYAFARFEIVDASTAGWYKVPYGDNFGYVSSSYVRQYTSPVETNVSIARNITKDFEGSGFTQVTGNFDGQGLSLGYLQWCLGQGSLQPLLYRADNEFNAITRQAFGTNYDSLHSMLGMDTIDEQLSWAKGINSTDQKYIIEPWKTQFINLCKTTEFQNVQKDAEVQTLSRAMTIVNKYKLKSVRGFALAFDIANQNGSVKSSVATVIDSAIAAKPNMTERELLGVIANAVADGSVSWSEDVRARKMAIVNGSGYVHGKTFYLDRDYGLNDNPWQ